MTDAPQPSLRTVQRAAEFAARASYGKLLARLATRAEDVVLAEDALSEAFAAALATWPTSGVPMEPEAWIWTVAQRKAVDMARHSGLRRRPDIVAELLMRDMGPVQDAARIPDDRLRLMLVCSHPAIDAGVRTALILQTVLGVEAKTMSSLFLVSPDAMAKRLVRAKAKIRAAGIRFEEPQGAELVERVNALLEAVYAAYALGREGAIVEGDTRDELRREALYLTELLAHALPNDAEVLGFQALLRFCEARRSAQTSPAGAFVPILEQDAASWHIGLMEDGYRLLQSAAALKTLGPFQLEAAIHGAHCYRAHTGSVPWAEIRELYGTLVKAFPTVGATVGLAVATAHADRSAAAGLAILHAITAAGLESYQPWWAAVGYLHNLAGNTAEARRCLNRALGLTSHPRLQAYFRSQLARLST